jgi:hypothetical protein
MMTVPVVAALAASVFVFFVCVALFISRPYSLHLLWQLGTLEKEVSLWFSCMRRPPRTVVAQYQPAQEADGLFATSVCEERSTRPPAGVAHIFAPRPHLIGCHDITFFLLAVQFSDFQSLYSVM